MRCSLCEFVVTLPDLEHHFRIKHWKQWMDMKRRTAREAREKYGKENIDV